MRALDEVGPREEWLRVQVGSVDSIWLERICPIGASVWMWIQSGRSPLKTKVVVFSNRETKLLREQIVIAADEAEIIFPGSKLDQANL